MKRIFVFLSLISFCSVLSCSKSSDTGKPANNYDIYLAGEEENSNGIYVAKYWKNGTPSSLTNGTNHAEAFDIFVTDNDDVYVCGYEESAGIDIPKYWKNGTAVNLATGADRGSANSIIVSNGDVYVAGYERNAAGKSVAKYWKNGIPVSLTDGTQSAEAYDIFISGTDIYVCGYEYNGTVEVAKYWKNAIPVILGDGVISTTASGIVVSGNDIYVSGIKTVSDYEACCWKNGIINNLTPGQRSEAMNMALSGTDVYIVGYVMIDPVTSQTKVVYWKNGTPVYVSGSAEEAVGYGIGVSGTDVVVGGDTFSQSTGNSTAKYWSNGTVTSVTNGNSDAGIYAVFLK